MDQAWTGRPGAEGAPEETNTEPNWDTNFYLSCMYAAQSTVSFCFKLDNFYTLLPSFSAQNPAMFSKLSCPPTS